MALYSLIHNVLAKVVSDQIQLPRAIIIVLDNGMIRFANHSNESLMAMLRLFIKWDPQDSLMFINNQQISKYWASIDASFCQWETIVVKKQLKFKQFSTSVSMANLLNIRALENLERKILIHLLHNLHALIL